MSDGALRGGSPTKQSVPACTVHWQGTAKREEEVVTAVDCLAGNWMGLGAKHADAADPALFPRLQLAGDYLQHRPGTRTVATMSAQATLCSALAVPVARVAVQTAQKSVVAPSRMHMVQRRTTLRAVGAGAGRRAAVFVRCAAACPGQWAAWGASDVSAEPACCLHPEMPPAACGWRRTFAVAQPEVPARQRQAASCSGAIAMLIGSLGQLSVTRSQG